MNNKDVAKTEYSEVAKILAKLTGEDLPFERMCKILNGRLDEEFGLFDFEYKHLTATVFLRNGKPCLSGNVELWQENGWDFENIHF